MKYREIDSSRIAGAGVTLLFCSTLLALSGCGEWKGSNTIDTEPAAESEGYGPGLVSGKEGGIVFYNDVWFGNAPGGGVPE